MQLTFSPAWFTLVDICISGVSAIVAFLLAIHIFKIYNFTKDLKHKYFSSAFMLICVAFVVNAGARLFSYYNLFARHPQGIAFYTFNLIHSSAALTAIGELVFRFLMLAGLLAIFHILERNMNKKLIALTLFFGALITLFSITHYYVFYVTTFVVCALITYRFLFNYFQKPSGKTASLLAGFAIITLSQAALILSALETVYVHAGLVQLLGYVMLLATYIQLRGVKTTQI